MINLARIVLSAVVAVTVFLPLAVAAAPCESELARALDAWEGEWAMADAAGKGRATISISPTGGDCGWLAQWSAGAFSGTVLFAFDDAEDRWLQLRTDARGATARLETVGDELAFEGAGNVNGEPFLVKMQFTVSEDGVPTQTVEESFDDGRTWGPPVVTRLLPLAEEPESADMPTTSMPTTNMPTTNAPTATSEGSVRTISREAGRDQLLLEDRPQVPLASPMVLEVESGAVHKFPDGAAWRTELTSEYVSNRVTVKEVTVARAKRKGGKVRLSIGVRAHTTRRGAVLKTQVGIISGDELVHESDVEEYKIGLSVPSYDADDGLTKTFEFEMEEAAFEALFADDARPLVRVRVETPAL